MRWGSAAERKSSPRSRSNASRTRLRRSTDRFRMVIPQLRHDLEVDPRAFVRPSGPHRYGVRVPGDAVDPAELVEEGTILVRGLAHAARMRMDGAHDREVRGQRVQLKDRMSL